MVPRGSDRPPGRPEIRSVRLETAPKSGGGVRWLTRLDPAGEAAYRAAVAPLAGRIERLLGPEVLASRTRPAATGRWVASWGPARVRWRRRLRAVLDDARPGVTFAVADVRDCYGSITAEAIEELLGPEAAHAAAFLRRLREHGVRGLPVGPEPSAVLANAALERLDRTLRQRDVAHLRWVDDLVLWGSGAEVRRALGSLRSRAASLGLELHERKTRRLADRVEAGALALGVRDSSIIAAP